MKRKLIAAAAAALSAMLLFTACGSGNSQSASAAKAPEEAKEEVTEAPAETKEEVTEAPEETKEEVTEAPEEVKEEVTEAPKETEAPTPEPTEEPKEETPEETKEDTAEDKKDSEVNPYAWLGLEDMPKCDYVDILSTYHYISVYDTYTMGFVVEETYAVDGINSYKENKNMRVYSVDGKNISINDAAKNYMEMDMSGTATAGEAAANLEHYKTEGINAFGRHFVGTGKGTIPLYSDEGDTAEYEYYEFDYPEQAEYGMETNEYWFMKDGDVFAISTHSVMGKTEIDSTNVIKSMSGDIPEGTIVYPDISELKDYTDLAAEE